MFFNWKSEYKKLLVLSQNRSGSTYLSHYFHTLNKRICMNFECVISEEPLSQNHRNLLHLSIDSVFSEIKKDISRPKILGTKLTIAPQHLPTNLDQLNLLGQIINSVDNVIHLRRNFFRQFLSKYLLRTYLITDVNQAQNSMRTWIPNESTFSNHERLLDPHTLDLDVLKSDLAKRLEIEEIICLKLPSNVVVIDYESIHSSSKKIQLMLNSLGLKLPLKMIEEHWKLVPVKGMKPVNPAQVFLNFKEVKTISDSFEKKRIQLYQSVGQF